MGVPALGEQGGKGEAGGSCQLVGVTDFTCQCCIQLDYDLGSSPHFLLGQVHPWDTVWPFTSFDA